MDRDQHEDLRRRIERLERRNRLWRRTGVGAIGAAVVLLVFGAATPAQRPGDAPRPVPEPARADPAQATIDATGMRTSYTNFFRVTGNPDEVVLDLGFHSQVTTAAGPEAVKVTDRMVMNFYTAKKLQAVLQTIVARHEAAFGEIQLDPQKRLRPKGVRE